MSGSVCGLDESYDEDFFSVRLTGIFQVRARTRSAIRRNALD